MTRQPTRRFAQASRWAFSVFALAATASWAAGNPDGHCTVPVEARADSIANPAHVIGNGTPASCTSAAFVAAVAQGGVITFNCGPDPLTIVLKQTAKLFNDKPNVVIDGGNKITLSGYGSRRILYMNTCDEAQHWTSEHCDTQDYPRLTVQNITLMRGNSTGQSYGLSEVYGGGAIFVRGGRLKVVNSRFVKNVCESTGPDLGGGAIRAFGGAPGASVYITKSSFGGGAGYGNTCSNGGAISGLATNFAVYNSLFKNNTAVGWGANPARGGTPGGGSGGAIYQDGNTISLKSCGNQVESNHANEGGGAFFFVSNNLTGTMSITDSVLRGNPNDQFETDGLPGIFVLAKPGQPVITNSIIER
ncbi:hypothetical protein [Ideonella sp. YS5]|uniref:hypothetical protein n=1 Tax=Ideonella sp. YS5 TaxID=3453714 RepID=UPI003EEB7991